MGRDITALGKVDWSVSKEERSHLIGDTGGRNVVVIKTKREKERAFCELNGWEIGLAAGKTYPLSANKPLLGVNHVFCVDQTLVFANEMYYHAGRFDVVDLFQLLQYLVLAFSREVADLVAC